MNTEKPAIFKDLPNWSKLIFAIVITLISTIIFAFIGLFLAFPFFDIGLQDLQNLGKTDNINFLKFMQVVESIGIFIFPAFLIAYLYSRKIKSYLKLNVRPKQSSLIYVIILTITAIPAINLFAQINIQLFDAVFPENNWMKAMEETTKETVEKFLNVESFPAMLFNLFMIAVIPAVGEELLFRGIGQKLLIDTFKNPHIGIFIAAFFFSFMHLEFYTFLPRFMMGLMFGYLFWWSGSLWMSIIPHFINNGLIVVAMYYVNKGDLTEKVETVGMDKSTMIFAIISVLIAAVLMWLIYKKEQRVL